VVTATGGILAEVGTVGAEGVARLEAEGLIG
jgi:hypothetical protein